MNKKPKISIVTCTYNRLEKVKRTAESVSRQNYQNYEHYILDDGSNDGTENYFFKTKSKNIKYLRFDENLGQPSLLFNSKIFDKLTGDYVVFLDSDDYLFDGAFDCFLEYHSLYKRNVWNFAFEFSDKKKNSYKNKNLENPKIVEVNSKDSFKDFHPRNLKKKDIKIL